MLTTTGLGVSQRRQLPVMLLALALALGPAISTAADAAATAAAAAAAANWSMEVPDLDGDDDAEAETGPDAQGWWTTTTTEATTTSAAVKRRHMLMKLRSLVRQEISRRSAAADAGSGHSKKAARLSDIVSAGHKLGAAVDREAAAAATGTTEAPPPAPNIFVKLWHAILKAMPMAAAIAMFVGIGLVLLLAIVLILYCCCCHNKADKMRRLKPTPQSLAYKDLDLTGANRPPYGTIDYSLEYDLKKDILMVTVFGCFDLPRGLDSMDPYVVVTMMSEKDEASGQTRGNKPKTSKVVRNTSNPNFNFTCSFPVKKKSELKEKVVVFEVFDWDYGLRHDMVARKVVHLRRLGEGLDEILGRSANFSKVLRKGLPRDTRGPGDICLSLYYAAKDMSLTVNVIECKGIFLSKSKEEPDLETLPNTFVRLSLRNPQLKKEHVKQTKTVFASRNPYFNQQFIFDVGGREMLDFCVLRVSLVHKTDTLRIKRAVGAVELHSNAEADSVPLLHWRELTLTPNRATARWHNFISPEEEDRKRKAREKEEKRRLQELQEEAEIAAAAAAKAGN